MQIIRAVLLTTGLLACAAELDQGVEDDAGAGFDYQDDGKADTGGIVPGSENARLVLRFVNVADEPAVREAGISARVARDVVAHRAGPDARLDTDDDDPYDSLAELDAIPYVGPLVFRALLAAARTGGSAPAGACAGGGWQAVRVPRPAASLAVDGLGAVHLVEHEGGGVVAYTTNATGAWTTARIATGLGECARPQVVVDSAVHVLCADPLGESAGLYYLTNAGGRWQRSAVETMGAICARSSCAHPSFYSQSLALDPTGAPRVSYVWTGNGGYNYLALASLTPTGAWRRDTLHTHSIDEPGAVSDEVDASYRVEALAIAAGSGVDVVFQGTSRRGWNRYVALASKVAGGARSTLIEQGAGDAPPWYLVGANAAVAGDRVWMTYEDRTDYLGQGYRGYIKVARLRGGAVTTAHVNGTRSARNGFGNDVQVPATPGHQSTIAIDPQGHPHLAFVGRQADGSWALTHAWLDADDPTSTWRFEVLQAATEDLDSPAAIQIGRDGRLAITHWTATGWDVLTRACR